MAGLRLVDQTLQLLLLLLVRTPRPDVLLVQTPPALPTLPLALFAARVRRSLLAIDWHNLGHTIVALRLGEGHRAVRATRWVEQHCGSQADVHLCVSEQMQRVLRERWNLRATAVHDRPAPVFRALDGHERRSVRARFGIGDDTGLVVTATSWTPDEELSMLLEAVARLDERIAVQLRHAPFDRFPKLEFVITGKGEGRHAFEKRLAGRSFRFVTIRTDWLPWQDYADLLAAADLGISLHRSSSGIDLPMKILDMFGAGLPVCALDYGPALDELVRVGRNGVLFGSSGELASLLFDLFRGFPSGAGRLGGLRRGAREENRHGWDEEWRDTAAPVLGIDPRSA